MNAKQKRGRALAHSPYDWPTFNPETIEPKLSSRVIGAHSLCEDLQRSHQQFTTLVAMHRDDGGRDEADITEMLWHTAVMFYARCFASAQERNANIHERALNRLPSELIAEHKKLITMRDQYLAHASSRDFEFPELIVTLAPLNQMPEVRGLRYTKRWQVGATVEAYLRGQRLVEHVLVIAKEQLSAAEDKLWAKLRERPITELYALAGAAVVNQAS
jgi:hypothetical protein